MNINKKLNKQMKEKYSYYTYLSIKNNIEIILDYIVEDKNIFYNYLNNIMKKDYKFTYLEETLLLFKNNAYLLDLQKQFSFTKIFKIYFEFINHEVFNDINKYIQMINNILTNDKDYNNFILDIIDTIYPYLSNHIDLIDFIDNIKYKTHNNHDLFKVYNIYKVDKDKINLLKTTFCVLYPQYIDDIERCNLTPEEYIHFEKFYVLLKYIPKKIRFELYENDFLLLNYYDLLLLNEKFVLTLDKIVNISTLCKDDFHFLTTKEFSIFIDKIDDLIFMNKIVLPRKLSFKETIVLFDFTAQEFKNVDFLYIYYFKCLSKYKEIEIMKNIQYMKDCLLDSLSFKENIVLTDELVEIPLSVRKNNDNPLKLKRASSYFIYFYILCYKKHKFKSTYQQLFDDIKLNINELDENLILILLFNMKYKTKYTNILQIKEIQFFIKYLDIPEKFVLENATCILENLINGKYLNLIKLCKNCSVLSDIEKKERLYEIAYHLIMNKPLDINKEIYLLAELLNIPLTVPQVKKWFEPLEISHKEYHFKEITDINEKWNIGLSPIRTCIAWDKGVFKESLPSIFSPHIKVFKIFKNNECIGRTIISLNVNKKKQLSLLIHKIYAKNTSLEVQKEVGNILFEELKPFAKQINADLLLFVGRKRVKNGLYTQTNEIDIEFKEYELIVTKNYFDLFFDPLGINYTSDMKRKELVLILDDICYIHQD